MKLKHLFRVFDIDSSNYRVHIDGEDVTKCVKVFPIPYMNRRVEKISLLEEGMDGAAIVIDISLGRYKDVSI